MAAFHDTDTDILARILADTSDKRDFLKLFLLQVKRGSRPTRRHSRDNPREDVGEDVGVVVVECGLYRANAMLARYMPLSSSSSSCVCACVSV